MSALSVHAPRGLAPPTAGPGLANAVVQADGSLIELSGQGRSIAVGRFVRPELRRGLADELGAALRRCGTASDLA